MKPKVTPAAARFVRHLKRPAWGVGRVVDVFSGLTRVRFADGELREFREDVLAPVDDSEATPELRALSDVRPPAPVQTAPRRVRATRAAKNAAGAAGEGARRPSPRRGPVGT